MLSTNAVLVALAAADGPIDKMELATDVFADQEMQYQLANYQAAAAAGTKPEQDIHMIALFKKYFERKCKGKVADDDAVMAALVGIDGVIDKLELATGQLNAGQRGELAMIQASGGAQAGWRGMEWNFFLHSFADYIDQVKAHNL